MQIDKNIYNDLFLRRDHQKLAIQATKSLYNLENFMIDGDINSPDYLELFKITSGNSHKRNSNKLFSHIIFKIKFNLTNKTYLENNFCKKYFIFIDHYLYKCNRIEGKINKNDITLIVNKMRLFTDDINEKITQF